MFMFPILSGTGYSNMYFGTIECPRHYCPAVNIACQSKVVVESETAEDS
jgi:hypothetical protein